MATFKDNIDHTVREDTLREVFSTLTKLIQETPLHIIIVHGAGGHVHHLAHKYELRGGTQDDPQKEAGAIHTQNAVAMLHQEIIKIGNTSGLSLLSFPTHSVIKQANRKIIECNTKEIHTTLQSNQIPVLYGDMVNDVTLGMSICSGDAVAAHLSTLLPVTHMLFATDVNGIYTSDPHANPGAQLVEELTFEEMEKTIHLTESHNKDTTGGLQGKMKECAELFSTSKTLKEIHIFNGLNAGNYQNTLTNKEFPHTRIKK